MLTKGEWNCPKNGEGLQQLAVTAAMGNRGVGRFTLYRSLKPRVKKGSNGMQRGKL